MNILTSIVAVAFWTCAALVVYAYLGYPLVIWWLARWFGRPVEPPPPLGEERDLPTVSLVIAAYNEEAVIEERLHNALATDYPPGKFEVVVGSDGSTDRTPALVRGFADRRVRLLDYAQRRGKAAVLNAAMAEVRGEIVVLSDANTAIDPNAVRHLVRWFQDPAVGAVCGRLVLTDPRTGRNVDSLYWKYETFLKQCEGHLGALLGANGAIYAIRRALYTPIPEETIVDDFVIPLLAKARTGCAIIYECGAIAREETPPDLGSEFHRRSRIGAGGFQSIGMLWRLLDPRRGWVAFTFLSHKILRWLCPFFLLGLLASNLLLVLLRGWPLDWYALYGQLGFYLASLLAALVPGRLGPLKPLRLAALFTSMNTALLVGFWRWLRGSQQGTWRRTARVVGADGVAR
ncbi:MAG: glycosyltransferase family 2 protein [Isosphaeraceae bacterium]|nr:glycosyltransferase family 2 protein [Isosphaeraceae bacterium]